MLHHVEVGVDVDVDGKQFDVSQLVAQFALESLLILCKTASVGISWTLASASSFDSSIVGKSSWSCSNWELVIFMITFSLLDSVDVFSELTLNIFPLDKS